MSDFGLKCWFVSLAASIIASLYQLKQLQTRFDLVSEKSDVEQKKKLLK